MRSAAPPELRRKQLTVALALLALLALAGYAITSEGSGTRFDMLPALHTKAAHKNLLLDVASDGERILVVGEQGHILYSDDHGATWTHASVPTSLSITAVTFSDARTAWATAHDGLLLQSKDRGQSWFTKLTGSDIASKTADAATIRIEQLQAAIEQASAESLEDLEWALDDAQFAFEDASSVIEEGVTTPLLDVWFENEQVGYTLGAYGILLQTSDGGSTWSLLSDRVDNPDNFHLYGISRSVTGTQLVAGEAGTLHRSLDGGQNWQRLDSPYPGSFFGTVAAQDGGLLVFGLRGNVFRSSDDGATWASVNTGDQRTLLGGTTLTDGTIILVGSAGAVLASVDQGLSFNAITTTGSTVYSSVAETVDNKLMVVGFGGVSIIDRNSHD